MTSSSESEKEEESTTSKVSAMANGSQLHVMTSLLSCIREDASAVRSRDSAAVATVSRAVTTTATKSQPSPISQQWEVRNLCLMQNHFSINASSNSVLSLSVIFQQAMQPPVAPQAAIDSPTADHSVAAINADGIGNDASSLSSTENSRQGQWGCSINILWVWHRLEQWEVVDEKDLVTTKVSLF